MWIVREHKDVYKVLKKTPKHVQVNYIAWKRIVELQGPRGLRAIEGFYDKALKGAWEGFRSSRLVIKWRVIYRVENKEFMVYVVEVSPHIY